MADQVQQYTVNHTGSVLGESYVTRKQNQTNPQLASSVLTIEAPKKFDKLEYVGGRDATRFVPRTMETFDGDGANATFALTGDVQPVAGEEQIEDQDYPAVVAYDTAGGAQIDVESIDYSTNEVTLASAPATGTDSLKVYHIINEGTINLRALNQFGQIEGTVYPWATPLYRFHDYEQLKRGTEVNLEGSVTWQRYEQVEVLIDSPQQIVWEDADYPEGNYVSTFEQDLSIYL